MDSKTKLITIIDVIFATIEAKTPSPFLKGIEVALNKMVDDNADVIAAALQSKGVVL